MLYNKLVLLITISQLAYAANLVKLNTQLKACNLKCDKYKDAAAGNNPIAKANFAACARGCNLYVSFGITANCQQSCSDLSFDNSSQMQACIDGCTQPEESPKEAIPVLPISQDQQAVVDEIDQKQAIDTQPLIDVIQDPVPALMNSSEDDKDNMSDESNISSSEEEQDDSAKSADEIFDLSKILTGLIRPSILIKGEPYAIDQTKAVSDESSQIMSASDALGSYFNFHGLTDKLFDNFEKILQSLPDKGNGNYIYTAEVLPDGQVKENFKSLDGLSANSKSSVDNHDVPFMWKGRPLLINAPPRFAFEEADDNSQLQATYSSMHTCQPIQLRFSTFCHDINNLFNCVAMYTRLPRWFILFTVVLLSCFFVWMGVFLMSMVGRMNKRQMQQMQAVCQQDDYLPLYKDLKFDFETRIEAGPLPEKQKLPETI